MITSISKTGKAHFLTAAVLLMVLFILPAGSAYADWPELDKLLAADGAEYDYFGESVSISGDYAIVGAYLDDDNGPESGSAYIFFYNGTSWSQQAKLLASDGAANDWFGYSVSISGDYAIVGARRDDSYAGSAYIFKRDGTNWSQQAKLVASDRAIEDHFGISVSISGDYAIVGACQDDDNGTESGSAYIFKRRGTSWSEQAKLVPSDGDVADFFGNSVSISGDYAIAGADGDHSYTGSAYIFYYNGTSWSEQAKLVATDGAAYDYFGISVSISGDYAIVGADLDDDNGTNSGSAYIFKRSRTGWRQQAKLLAADGTYYDEFGYSVSISGEYAIVGAYCDDDNGTDSGSAYIFERSGTNWSEKAKLLASDGAAGDRFGSVSVSGDYAIVGARHDDDNGSNSGSAYMYIHLPEPKIHGTKWHDTDGDGRLVEDTDEGERVMQGWRIYIDENENGQFDAGEPTGLTDAYGNYVLIAPAAGTWLVAEEVRPCWEQTYPGGDGTYSVTLEAGEIATNYNFGNARSTEIHPSGWGQQDKLVAADGAASDIFGISVSVSGDYAIVAALYDDDNGPNSGSAYIFAPNDVICSDWDEAAKLTASDGADLDYFGKSVSISGDYAIVGAYGDGDSGSYSGSAYIFKRDGTSWSQQAKLLAADGYTGDYFGRSVSISGDYVIVGAYGDDDNGSGSGSAYIFYYDGESWSQQAKLTASDGAASDAFGVSVSISGDYAIVGAPWDDDNGSYSGSAYIFFFDGTSWSEQAKLTASVGAANDYFGVSVSISGDYAIVGANRDDDNGDKSGSAYIFERSGTNWSEQAKLVASDGAASDYLGISVSISGDYAIVGACYDDDNGTDSGSAYMFGKVLCPSADLTGDCFVDFKDFAEVAGQWLQGAL